MMVVLLLSGKAVITLTMVILLLSGKAVITLTIILFLSEKAVITLTMIILLLSGKAVIRLQLTSTVISGFVRTLRSHSATSGNSSAFSLMTFW